MERQGTDSKQLFGNPTQMRRTTFKSLTWLLNHSRNPDETSMGPGAGITKACPYAFSHGDKGLTRCLQYIFTPSSTLTLSAGTPQRVCKVAYLERVCKSAEASVCAKLWMTLQPTDNFWLKLPGNQAKGTVKGFQIDLAPFEVWLCEWAKCHIMRHQSVLFYVVSWKGCYWVFEGVLWYVRCSVPGERIKLMIRVNMCVSALTAAPVSSMFCQKCLVQQAEGISHGGSLTVPKVHIFVKTCLFSLSLPFSSLSLY